MIKHAAQLDSSPSFHTLLKNSPLVPELIRIVTDETKKHGHRSTSELDLNILLQQNLLASKLTSNIISTYTLAVMFSPNEH